MTSLEKWSETDHRLDLQERAQELRDRFAPLLPLEDAPAPAAEPELVIDEENPGRMGWVEFSRYVLRTRAERDNEMRDDFFSDEEPTETDSSDE